MKPADNQHVKCAAFAEPFSRLMRKMITIAQQSGVENARGLGREIPFELALKHLPPLVKPHQRQKNAFIIKPFYQH